MGISKSFFKKFLTSIVFIATFGFATVTVDGYALLENQTDHSGVTITFERTAPSSLTETATTDANGLFTAQLETGIYNVTYTKDGYFSESLSYQSFYANTTLSSLTLLEHTTLINVPSLFSTIQSAIDVAINGDTVLVQPGTYVENINFSGKNIVIGSLVLTTQDTSYNSSTIIDGNQNGSVVTFNGEDTTAVLSGFTIQNGSADSGGGIYCQSSSPTLTNLTISGNSADSGGGIKCNYSSPTLTNVTISGNSADNGGGISSSSSSPTMTNVTISGNSAGNGGGIYCGHYSSPTLTNVTISGNTAYRGGGIYCTNESEPTMTNVTISGNTATDNGGGIYCNYSSPTLTNVTISGNTAADYGGGIYCQHYSSPTLTNVTINGNTAYIDGGGIYCDNSSPTLTNSIISHNIGNYEIYVESGNPTITYSNFYNNQNGNVYYVGSYVGVNVTTNVNGDSCDAYNNIPLDPEFVDINNNNYRLQNWSQLIGAGTTTNAPTTDIEGNPRPNPSGSNPDIGAYENPYGVPQYQPQVLNVPTDYSTIQAALTAAIATDTVLVQPGTYTENIIWPETNGIKLISAGDSSNTIIDGGWVSSVIYMNPQTATIDTTTLIKGFKITNGGNVNNGGGLFINNASLSISHLLVIDNEANDNCGGIYFPTTPTPGQSVIRNITIMNNTAYNDGGGLCCGNSIEILKNAVIKGNIATNGHGGGIIIAGAINLVNVIINNVI